MPNKLGICRQFAVALSSCACSVLLACSGDDAGGGAAAVLTQAPHCPAGADALKIEGTIAGAAIDDTRTMNLNAGFENATSGRFATPFFNLFPLEPNQVALTIEWPHSLFNGQSSAISTGTLTLPATHPQALATFCVSAGQVGFVDGGSEDGALKFAVTEVKSGADCSGAATADDLRGCQNSE